MSLRKNFERNQSYLKRYSLPLPDMGKRPTASEPRRLDFIFTLSNRSTFNN